MTDTVNWKDDPKVKEIRAHLKTDLRLVPYAWASVDALCEAVAASVPSAGGESVHDYAVQWARENPDLVPDVAMFGVLVRFAQCADAAALAARPAGGAKDVRPHLIAGMISTLDFTPSTRHPDECVPLAMRILEAVPSLAASSPGTGAVTEAMLVDVRDAILGKTGEGDPPSLATLNALQKFDRLTAALSGAGRDGERETALEEAAKLVERWTPIGVVGGTIARQIRALKSAARSAPTPPPATTEPEQ